MVLGGAAMLVPGKKLGTLIIDGTATTVTVSTVVAGAAKEVFVVGTTYCAIAYLEG